jgi:protease YdgD
MKKKRPILQRCKPWGCHLLTSVLFAASMVPTSAQPLRSPIEITAGSPLQPVAVFGTDERVPLPAGLKSMREKMGMLFNLRARTVCTAFCIARDTIATAGHCLHRTAGQRPPRLSDFWFARNYDAVRDYARIAGRGSPQYVVSGSARLNVRPPIDASKDWAVVRLSRPVCAKGVLPVRALPSDEVIAAAGEGRVFQVSYHRDFTPWKLAYSRTCSVSRSFEAADWTTIAQDFSDPDALILHTCDTGGASSGSPLLIETPAGPEVIGINVGTYVQSKVLMQAGQVTRRLKADTVANTAVSATAFAARLEAFREAAILGTPAQLRELQTQLQHRDLFDGKVDGTYSADLRAAIEAYEAAEGLPVTGLATHALLKRLGGGTAKLPRAKS